MKTILVTGGAGYIGSITVRRLIEKGYNVIVYDNLSTGFRGAVSPHATFIEGDINEKGKLRKALKGVDAVIHFASFIAIGESVLDPAKYYDNNISKNIVFLDTLRRSGVKKIIFSSSAGVYGYPDEMPVTEDALCDPLSPYGETKYIVEKMLESYRKAYGINYVCLRYFNAAGSAYNIGEAHNPETHLIPIVFEVVSGKRDKMKIFGDDYDTPDGTNIRDYVHVLDLADAHIKALNVLGRGESAVYNLGSGIGYSVREIIDACREVTGHAIPEEVIERRPGDPDKLIADVSKIKRELRWSPNFSIKEIVKSAWDWHKKNPNGY